MPADILDTLFALAFAVVLIAVFWNIIMYFSEMGSEEGKKEYKSMIIDWVTWLLVLMVIFALVSWLRGLLNI